MKYNLVSSLIFASSVLAAYVPSEPWSTLTPDSPSPSGASTDYAQPFGIQIVTVSAASATPTAAKRDVEQISDGQPQANSNPLQTTTAAVVQQIGDGQIQHQSTAAAAVVQQIGDGQIQHQTTAAAVVQQIGDGQIQHQTSVAAVVQQIGDGQIQHQTSVTGVVQQIGDGQIQHQTTAANVVQQIGDGQIQHQTQTTVKVVDQISDGQVQHVTTTLTTVAAASQVTDGQVQNTAAPATNVTLEACSTENSLSMTIKDGLLTDSKGRVGAIVANRQFQFDGPPPQAGSIYAAGWSVTKDGYLALGNSTEFYQCLSGDFYNLYDQSIGAQCSEVKLGVVNLVSC